jgi:hypothetical protein
MDEIVSRFVPNPELTVYPDLRYIDRHSSRAPEKGEDSPWGKIQEVEQVAEGIWFIDAEGHAGYFLASEPNAQISSRSKNRTQFALGNAGWYEIERDGYLVEYRFPQYFKWHGEVNDRRIAQTIANHEFGARTEEERERYFNQALETLSARQAASGKSAHEGFSRSPFDPDQKVAPGMITPWGRAEAVKQITDGIWQVETAGHGGYFVVPELNALIANELKQDTWNGLGKAGWYEEDCDGAIVQDTFREHFRDKALDDTWMAEMIDDGYGTSELKEVPDADDSNLRTNWLYRRTRAEER